jgi:hypothetical protein
MGALGSHPGLPHPESCISCTHKSLPAKSTALAAAELTPTIPTIDGCTHGQRQRCRLKRSGQVVGVRREQMTKPPSFRCTNLRKGQGELQCLYRTTSGCCVPEQRALRPPSATLTLTMKTGRYLVPLPKSAVFAPSVRVTQAAPAQALWTGGQHRRHLPPPERTTGNGQETLENR